MDTLPIIRSGEVSLRDLPESGTFDEGESSEFTPKVAQETPDYEGAKDLVRVRLSSLSPRQREVYGWICKGKKDREIAEILGISYRTVTEHVRAILAKLQVPNRTSAALMAMPGPTDLDRLA